MKQRLNSGLSQHLSKRLRTFDRKVVLGDEILYRDENYFLNLKAGGAQPIVLVASNLTKPEVNSKAEVTPTPTEKNITMTAPIEEKGDSGPLVPCQVPTNQNH